jgi:hypothetical protein
LSVPIALDKDVESLDKAIAELDQHIHRLSLARLTVLFLTTLLFALGLFEGRAGEISQLIREIQETASANKLAATALDPFSLLFDQPGWEPQRGEASPPPEIYDRLQKAALELTKRYATVFGVSMSVLGTAVKFDLRVFLMTLPLWLPLWHVYIACYRLKRDVLWTLAKQRVRGSQAGVRSLDRILYSSSSPQANTYAEFPRRLLEWTYWFSLVVLACCFLWLTRGVITTRGAELPIALFLNWCLAFTLWATLLIEYIRRRMSLQLSEPFGVAVPAQRTIRYLHRARETVRQTLRQAPSALTRPAGALMMTATLFLATGYTACGSEEKRLTFPPFKLQKIEADQPKAGAKPGVEQEPWVDIMLPGDSGIHILTGESMFLPTVGTSIWVATGDDESTEAFMIGVSMVTYGCTVALALVSLLLMVGNAFAGLSFGSHSVRTATFAIVSLNVLQMASAAFLTFFWFPIWLYLFCLWWRDHSSLFRSRSGAWERLLPWLQVAAAPVVIAALYLLVIGLVDPPTRFGYLAYCVGLVLFAHGTFATRPEPAFGLAPTMVTESAVAASRLRKAVSAVGARLVPLLHRIRLDSSR